MAEEFMENESVVEETNESIAEETEENMEEPDENNVEEANSENVDVTENATIDDVYNTFVKGVVHAIGSTSFYEFFMDAISQAQNEFQFSNRKLIKTVDLDWVDAVEESLNAFQNIISSPRNIIKEEELIVNVANAKRAGSETVRHLAQHASLVEHFDADSGDVRPSRLMQRYREDSIGLYENRLVFTTMEAAHHFVKIRHDALFEVMSDEFGAKLKINSDMESATEHVHMDMYMHIKEIDSALETDKKNGDIFGEISRIHRVLSVFMNSPFAQKMAKQPRVRGNVTKTNVLKKNKDYSQIVKLFEFLRKYDDVGYTIRVVEQNPEIDARFEQDIYHNILFNYLILKGYLEDEKDREMPKKQKGRNRALKPKVIKEIIEELTEDYDLPDVEIRKVLIEELTKEQLMQEEASERLRLVEEQEQRRKAEEERVRSEEEAERKRLEKEKEAKEERIRLEQEAKEQERRQKQMERNIEDRRRSKIFKAELEHFAAHLEEYLELRKEEEHADAEKIRDFGNLVRKMEKAELRRKEEKKAERKRKQEETQREMARAQAVERAEQQKKDLAALEPYIVELNKFSQHLVKQRALRENQMEMIRQKQEEREKNRRERLANAKHK